MNSDYIFSIIEKGKRLDGRGLEEHRKVELETGISKNAEGSAKCKIGDTEVLVGVKMDLGEPYPDSPDEGTIIVTAELSPLASPDFDLGPPGVWATEIARIVDRGVRESKTIDFKKLCIEKGKKIWMVFIDIYPINDDGNLIDASMLATIAALKSAKYPKLEKKGDEYKVNREEPGKKALDLNVAPITTTVSDIKGNLIVDCLKEEEEVAETRLSIAVRDGKVYALQKGNSKSLKVEQIEKMIGIAIKKEKELRKLI